MFSDTDFSNSVKGLKTPMLVIFGEYDFKDEEALMRRTFLKWYPNAQLECCKNAGHFPMLEAPAPLAASIEKFLNEHKE
jgi:pimeloyl-ACP methyl ester carboxylesterase